MKSFFRIALKATVVVYVLALLTQYVYWRTTGDSLVGILLPGSKSAVERVRIPQPETAAEPSPSTPLLLSGSKRSDAVVIMDTPRGSVQEEEESLIGTHPSPEAKVDDSLPRALFAGPKSAPVMTYDNRTSLQSPNAPAPPPVPVPASQQDRLLMSGSKSFIGVVTVEPQPSVTVNRPPTGIVLQQATIPPSQLPTPGPSNEPPTRAQQLITPQPAQGRRVIYPQQLDKAWDPFAPVPQSAPR